MRRNPARLTGENRLIQLLQDRFQTKHPLIKKGIGDDAAVIDPKGAKEYWVITTDMLMENIDFRRESITPARLGCKSLAANLSDLAAMGARPRFFTMSLAVPSGISQGWILRFYSGMCKLGWAKGALLVGGDWSRSESGISIAVTALGESLNRKVVYRSGGRQGDLLYVTGTLGKAAAGMRLTEKGRRRSMSASQRSAVAAHQEPQPRCEVGLWLAQSGLVRCMMDISDGLSMDLPRICAASAVGAEIYASRVPMFKEASRWGYDPLELALHGGEDFELLFAVPQSQAALLEKSYPAGFPKIACIGKLTGERGVVRLCRPGKKPIRLAELGYDHFRTRSPNEFKTLSSIS